MPRRHWVSHLNLDPQVLGMRTLLQMRPLLYQARRLISQWRSHLLVHRATRARYAFARLLILTLIEMLRSHSLSFLLRVSEQRMALARKPMQSNAPHEMRRKVLKSSPVAERCDGYHRRKKLPNAFSWFDSDQQQVSLETLTSRSASK